MLPVSGPTMMKERACPSCPALPSARPRLPGVRQNTHRAHWLHTYTHTRTHMCTHTQILFCAMAPSRPTRRATPVSGDCPGPRGLWVVHSAEGAGTELWLSPQLRLCCSSSWDRNLARGGSLPEKGGTDGDSATLCEGQGGGTMSFARNHLEFPVFQASESTLPLGSSCSWEFGTFVSDFFKDRGKTPNGLLIKSAKVCF